MPLKFNRPMARPVPQDRRPDHGQVTLAFGVEPATAAYRLRLARYQALAEAIAEHLRASPQDRLFQLLDIGAGRGRTLRYLEAEGVADRVQFHGIDLSPERLAGIYRPERWRLVQGDVTLGLPYAPGQFDIVVCEQVLEHLARPRDVLNEIGRVMKPGGLLVTGVPTFLPGITSLRRHIVPVLDRVIRRRRGHVQTYSKRRFLRQIREAGCFEVAAVRGFRVVSDGAARPLEEFRWWWRLNRRIGEAAPSLCIEIQVLARRR